MGLQYFYIALSVLILASSASHAQAPDPGASPRATAKQAAENLEKLTRMVLEADRSEMTEEELQQLQFIERSLPMLQQGLSQYSTMLQENPMMRPAVNVLGKVTYFNQIQNKEMREQLEIVLEPLLIAYAEEHNLTPSLEETKKLIAQQAIPDKALIADMKAREAKIAQSLKDDTLSMQQMEKLAVQLDETTKARQHMEALVANIQQAPENIYVGLKFLLEKNVMLTRAIEKIIEDSGQTALYETSRGAEPMAAYKWFLNRQEALGNLDYIYTVFKRDLENYIDQTIQNNKIEQAAPKPEINTPG